MAQKTDESCTLASRPDAAYFIELEKRIQQLLEVVERCSLRADSSSEAQAVKQQVATLLVALKERCLLPYDAPALSRPKDVGACGMCGTQELVTRMTPVTLLPSGTQGHACPTCAVRRTNGLWYA